MFHKNLQHNVIIVLLSPWYLRMVDVDCCSASNRRVKNETNKPALNRKAQLPSCCFTAAVTAKLQWSDMMAALVCGLTRKAPFISFYACLVFLWLSIEFWSTTAVEIYHLHVEWKHIYRPLVASNHQPVIKYCIIHIKCAGIVATYIVLHL